MHALGSGPDSATDSPTSPTSPITVYLLDDHEVVRHGLRGLLERDGDIVVVGESALAQEAVSRIPALRPDVAILDVRLPDGSGVEVCRQVHAIDPSIPALMLTSFDEDQALFDSIMAGASGYLLKQVRGGELAEAVRRVAAGQSMLDPVMTTHVLDRLRSGPPADPLLKHLTPKEREVLSLVGEGLTNREIACHLGLAEKTTRNYVSAVLSKLGVRSRTQAALIAHHVAGETDGGP